MVYVALVADVLVGAYADINYSSSTQMDVMMTLVFQACAFLLTIMCFYNMLAETNLVKRAMFSKLAREFSTPLFLAGLYFVFILVSRFYRLALVYNSYPHLQIWKEPGFTGLYATMKCAKCGVLLRGGVVDAETFTLARTYRHEIELSGGRP